MESSFSKIDILEKYKEDDQELIIKENELLRSPKLKRFQSKSPIKQQHGSFQENIPDLQPTNNPPALQHRTSNSNFNPLLRTPTKQRVSSSNFNKSRVLQPLNARNSPPKFILNTPSKSKLNDLKVSLTPAQRIEKKPGKLLSSSDILSSYEFKETIGRGAFASVYRALNKNNGNEVAVKEIIIEDKDNLLELMFEIDLLKVLKHENIVKYHGFVKNNSKLFIFLEYCSGGSLRTLYKKKGVLLEPLLIKYLKQVLKGLIYLHDQGIIHRDIKAANILLDSNGKIKLTDFGVSTKLSTNTIKTYSIAGTPNWMAPEIISMDGASTASDIWSLGATVVELLTGEPLYSHMNDMYVLRSIVEDDNIPLPKNISVNCRNFLLKCFEKEPSKRLTAKELLNHEWLQQRTAVHSTDDFNEHEFSSDRTNKFLPSNSPFIDNNKLTKFDNELINELSEVKISSIANNNNTNNFLPINDDNLKKNERFNELKTKLIESPKDLNIVKEFNQFIETEDDGFIDFINGNEINDSDDDFIIFSLRSLEKYHNNEKLCLEYLSLIKSIFLNDINNSNIINFLDYGGFLILIKLLSNKFNDLIRVHSTVLLNLIFNSNSNYLKEFIRSGGLKISLKLLQENFKSTPELPLFVIDLIFQSFNENLISKKILKSLILNLSNALEWIGVILMEVIHSKKLNYIDECVEIITQFNSFESTNSSFDSFQSNSLNHLKNIKKEVPTHKPIFLISIFKIHEKLSIQNQIKILEFLNNLNLSDDVIKESQLLKFLAKRLKQVSLITSKNNKVLDLLCLILSKTCHLNFEKQFEIVSKYEMLATFQNLLNLSLPCINSMIPLFCEFSTNTKLLPVILENLDVFFQAYNGFLLNSTWRSHGLDSLLVLNDQLNNNNKEIEQDLILQYLINDKNQLLIKSFAIRNCANVELYLEKLIKLFSNYKKSMKSNKLRLLFLNNNKIIEIIFEMIKENEHENEPVLRNSLFRLLKILTIDNFIYDNYYKIMNFLKSLKANSTNSLIIDELIDEILGNDFDIKKLEEENNLKTDSHNSSQLMGPPKRTKTSFI